VLISKTLSCFSPFYLWIKCLRENFWTPKSNSGASNMKLIFGRNISVVTWRLSESIFRPCTYITYLRVTLVLNVWWNRPLCSSLQMVATYVLENVQYNYSAINQVLLLMLKTKTYNFYFKSVARMFCPNNPQLLFPSTVNIIRCRTFCLPGCYPET
jgi:prepilin signal peptidase PulO-like enzyme (type II secretory pathway)